jgi:predicted RNA-binding Zn ribbon-like protein
MDRLFKAPIEHWTPDNSRSRRRQWCDMADCGNLAKVRRFRERQR